MVGHSHVTIVGASIVALKGAPIPKAGKVCSCAALMIVHASVGHDVCRSCSMELASVAIKAPCAGAIVPDKVVIQGINSYARAYLLVAASYLSDRRCARHLTDSFPTPMDRLLFAGSGLLQVLCLTGCKACGRHACTLRRHQGNVSDAASATHWPRRAHLGGYLCCGITFELSLGSSPESVSCLC